MANQKCKRIEKTVVQKEWEEKCPTTMFHSPQGVKIEGDTTKMQRAIMVGGPISVDIETTDKFKMHNKHNIMYVSATFRFDPLVRTCRKIR